MVKPEAAQIVSPGMEKRENDAVTPEKKVKPSDTVHEKREFFKKKKMKLEEDRAREKEKKGAGDDLERDAAGGVMPKSPDVVKKVELDTLKRQREETEKQTINALKEKHAAEIEGTLTEVDFSTLDETTKKSLHADTLSKKVDISKTPDAVKREALKGIPGIDEKSIDMTKLTPDQIELIQRYQSKKYLEALAQISDEEKKDPEKLKLRLIELEKQNTGITDFTTQQKIEFLNQKDFFEAAKKDSSILSETIESIRTDGILATGIDPESEIGKKLVVIAQGNIDEYMKLFPEEKDITKLAEIFSGSYVDIIGGIPMKGMENFQASLEATRSNIKERTFREGILREDYKTEEEYRSALEKSARESTGMGVQQIERVAKKISRSKLSPFVKFLADLIAPFGAMLGGEIGAFWRDYLNQSSEDQNDKSMANGGGGNLEQLGETNSTALINAARGYLGRPYKMGGLGRKDVPGDPIDCSQLVVNSLVDTGCLPAGADTTAMGFASMSQKIGNSEGKEGDFLIMGEPSPHIAIITANLGGGRYKTIESASGKGGVTETERTAGGSFSVYRNPFLEGNGGIKRRNMPADLAGMKDIMKTTNTKPEYVGGIEGAADKIKQNQARYERVAQATGVPWELIGAIHYRESSFDFGAALHNGDKIIGTGRKTYRVPAGRGPFNTWEESAIDALRMKGGLGFTSVNGSDDHLKRVAAYAERYNGYGYRNRGGVSPYVWGGTPLYKGGRFVADHVYDPNSYDKRAGVMPIILSLLKKNGVQPPLESQQDPTQPTGSPADWFRKNDDKLYGGGDGKYDCMTSTHAALGLDYTRQHGASFNGKYIDEKDSKHNLWNVSMAAAIYSGRISGANSSAPDGIIRKQSNGFYGQKYDDPSNMEYYIEENVMERTKGGKKVEVPGPGVLIHYGAGYDRAQIVSELEQKLGEGQGAMMGGTGEGTNKGGHEWLVVKEGGQLRVYESTKTQSGDWRGVVNGVNGSGYSLSDYLNNRASQHPQEAVIFSSSRAVQIDTSKKQKSYTSMFEKGSTDQKDIAFIGDSHTNFLTSYQGYSPYGKDKKMPGQNKVDIPTVMSGGNMSTSGHSVLNLISSPEGSEYIRNKSNIVICLGTNDAAQFSPETMLNNMRIMIQRVRTINPNGKILLVTPPRNGDPVIDAKIAKYVALLNGGSMDANLRVADFYKYSTEKKLPLLSDKDHLTSDGYQEMKRFISSSIAH